MRLKLPNAFRRSGPNAVLTRGSSTSFLIQTTGAGMALLLNIILARVLGSGGYGEYVYAISLVAFLSLFGSLGFNSASVKFIPIFISKNDYSSFFGYVRQSFVITFAFSCILCSLSLWFLHIYKYTINANLYNVLFWACLLIPINSLISLLHSFLRSLKKIGFSLFPEAIAKPLLMIVLLLGAHRIFHDSMSPQIVVFINVSTGVVIGIAMAMLFFRSIPSNQSVQSLNYDTRTWVRVAVPLLFVSGLNLILSRIDIVMIGTIASTEAAGIYAVASRIAGLGAFFLTAVNTIAAPMISELYSNDKISQLQSLISFSVRIIFIGSIFLQLLFLFSIITSLRFSALNFRQPNIRCLFF